MGIARMVLENSTSEVNKILDSLRPYIMADGGDVELVKIDNDGVVSIRMLGACAGCPASSFTQKMVIEKSLKEGVVGITEVVLVD